MFRRKCQLMNIHPTAAKRINVVFSVARARRERSRSSLIKRAQSLKELAEQREGAQAAEKV
jgi:hypothetical protein